MNTHSSEHLWQQFLAGNEDAFEVLVEQHEPILMRFLRQKTKDKTLAKDLEQEAWIRCFQYKKPIDNFKAFLITTAKRLVVDHYRSTQISNRVDASTMSLIDSNQYELYEAKEFLSYILNDRDYTIWQMFLTGYENEEIAKLLGLSKKRIENKKSEIRTKIKASMSL